MRQILGPQGVPRQLLKLLLCVLKTMVAVVGWEEARNSLGKKSRGRMPEEQGLEELGLERAEEEQGVVHGGKETIRMLAG